MPKLFKSPCFVKNNKLAFTLAEVLITLGIIGIVAAMTIPTLVNNSQKKAYVVALKKFYSTQNDGWARMLADDGVEQLDDTTAFSKMEDTCSMDNAGSDSTCTAFWQELQKHFKFKIINPPTSYTINYLRGTKWINLASNNQYVFAFPDGSVMFQADFYNKARSPYESEAAISAAGGHMFKEQGSSLDVDVNGFKGPNIIGRDVFSFNLSDKGILYSRAGNDFSIWYSGDLSNTWTNGNGCGLSLNDTENISSSYGWGCSARIMESGWEMNY